MPNVTLLPSNPTAPDELESIFSPKSSPPVVFADDPIAMACASYRAWKENFTARWLDLDAVRIQPQDREMAEGIRKFYRGRMTFQALKRSANMSSFRRKLYALVNDQLVITKEEIGLLHRLPYFYQEDLDLDQIFASTENTPSADITTGVCVYTPLKRVLRSRRSGDVVQYYYRSEQHSSPCLLSVRQDNPLVQLMESIFELPQVTLESTNLPKYYRGYHDTRLVYYMTSVKLVKA